MSCVNPLPSDVTRSIAYLLDRAHRRLQERLPLLVDMRAFPELRGSHFRLLSLVPAAGARPSELAGLASITRQSLGEMVRHLADHGYVDVAADPSDRRALLVSRTGRGDQAFAAATKGLSALEAEWVDEVGEERFATLLDVLADLADVRTPGR